MTWREMWAARIFEIHKDLPDDASLDDRIEAIKPLTPSKFDASWARKSWQAARRDYLVKYGYRPKTKKRAPTDQTALPLLGDL